MDNSSLSQLIARIYDTALDPDRWSRVLLDIAFELGGRGAMVFELTKTGDQRKISSPYFSENYDSSVIRGYMANFNDQEIIDQGLFAEISGEESRIQLIDDTAFIADEDGFNNRPNVKAMMSYGLKHRSGTLLNKDSWRIDRFAVQYANDRGPSSSKEKEKAGLILPHVAKALRVGRPLIQLQTRQQELSKRLNKLNFGVTILGADEHPILSNGEFDRILDAHPIFMRNREGKILLRNQNNATRYQSLIKSTLVHGVNGSRPRRESITFPLEKENTSLFVEICPAYEHPALGTLPQGARLITVLDTSSEHLVDPSVVSRFFPLSKSELQVLDLIARGLSNAEIADTRCRSLETVNSQTKSLLRKTFTRNRTELVQLSLSLNSPFSLNWLD